MSVPTALVALFCSFTDYTTMGYTSSFSEGLPPECHNVPAEFLDPTWIDDPKNLPYTALEENQFVFKAEADFEFAHETRRGVLFDLMKQLYGCRTQETTELYAEDGRNIEDLSFEELDEIEFVTNSRTFKPNPAQYQWWAWTAHALLNGDVTELNIRGTYRNSLDGGDVSKIINKLGFWKLDGEVDKSKRLTLARFAPLYARMYNNDPRYNSDAPAVKKLIDEKKLEHDYTVPAVTAIFTGAGHSLLTKDRESPLKYCGECGVITDIWARKVIKPGDPEYDKYFLKVKKQVANSKREKDAKPEQDRYSYRFVKLGN